MNLRERIRAHLASVLIVLLSIPMLVLLPCNACISFAAGTDSLTETEKNSTYGFFVWLSENASTADERTDAKIAAQILANTVSSEYEKHVFNQGNIYGGTHNIKYADLLSSMQLGDENDSTSLESLRDAINFVTLGNEYRAKENLSALKISSGLMAMAELNVDYQDVNNVFDHPDVFWEMENLAYAQIGGTWAYGNVGGAASDNPYEGWYTLEKKNYDSNNGEPTGHYETLTDKGSKMLITGFGVRHRYVKQMLTASDGKQYECLMHDKYYSQTFSSKSGMYDMGNGVTPEQYLAYLDQYMCIAVGHDLKVTKGVEPTCTSGGSIDYYTCTKCGKFFSDEAGKNEISEGSWELGPKGHSWSKTYTVDIPSDCRHEGSESIHCTVCGTMDPNSVRTIPVSEHNYTSWEITKEPTCEETGSKSRRCQDCGVVQTDVVDALEHDWDTEYKVDIEPTCTEEGSESRHCKRCGVKMDDAATGIRSIPAKGHKFGDWNITKEPTADEEGMRVRTCTVCNACEEERIEKLTPKQVAQKALEDASTVVADARKAATAAAEAKENADEAAKTPGAAAVEAAEAAETAAKNAVEAAETAVTAANEALEAAKAAYEPEDDEYKEADNLAQASARLKAEADDALSAATEAVETAKKSAESADVTETDEEAAKQAEAQKQAEAARKAAEAQALRDRDGIYDPKIAKVKVNKPAAKKNAITVKWKKLSKKQIKKGKVTHYEIWVSTSKAFPAGELTKEKLVKKSKASLKVKGLKKNTKYYVRVRAVRKAGNVKYVGKWKQKTIKTKK